MDPVALSTLMGALSTLVFPFVLQSHWSARVKSAVVLVICAVAGLEIANASGQLHVPRDSADVATVVADVTAVWVASQAVYMGLKKTGLLDSIERATDVTKPAPAVPPAVPAVPTVPTERPFGN